MANCQDIKQISILDTAIDLCLRGFSIIPIRPGADKRPYFSWKEFQKRRATEQEIENWFSAFPNANIAIVTGTISGLVVVDADGEIGRRWVSEHLPQTSVYARTGRESGYHCYFRYPVGANIPSKNGFQPKVDIKADGGYVIAPPSMHACGKEYKWLFREGQNGWDDLLEFNPYKMESKVGNLSGINWSAYKTQDEKDVESAELWQGVSAGSRNAALANILGKMIRAGCGGHELYSFAKTWNLLNQPPLPESELKATYRSIWNIAQKKKKENLQVVESEKISESVIEPAIEKAIEPVIEPIIEKVISKTDLEIRGKQTDSFPSECLQPGGLLSDILEYTEMSNAACKPLFALSGAICLLGHLLGQRVQTETGLGTNMYCVSIGYSGAGKNAPHNAISQLIAHTDARISMCPTDTTSGAALLRWLTTPEHQRALFMFDEIGMLLKGTKNQSSSLADLPKILTRMFSGTGRPEVKAFGDAKSTVTIPWHHLSIYGSSTPKEFWSNLSTEDSISGFLARLLVFEVLDDPVKPKLCMKPEIPPALIQKIDAIWGIKPPIDITRGDLAQVPKPFVIKRSDEANKILDEWGDKYWEESKLYKEESPISSLYNRAVEHAAKLSLIHCASLNGAKITERKIEPESIIWACKIVDHCIKTTKHGIERNISESKFHELQQKIMKILESSGPTPLRILYRKLPLPN